MTIAEEKLKSDVYIAKKDIFTIFPTFRIMDAQENLILYSRQKLFKLKEHIRVFDSREMGNEVLSIKARNIIDFSAAYDVFDSATEEKVGTLRRRGFKSMFRDHWEILDRNDSLFANIKEDSVALALIRRFVFNMLPQKFNIETTSGQKVGTISQRFGFFVHKFDVDFSQDQGKTLDRRLGIAAVILLLAIEGKQR